ncbi:hypothetical protein E2C01_047046 [Portunus trituberculatus]|uniref:Uncharacterized protein n=1 Tax=Portunus trituberculatus TaxID=210409 RepID=A0A5B7FZD1_PORTR|nr:hypothetical protein [Portunus trituberculatus]
MMDWTSDAPSDLYSPSLPHATHVFPPLCILPTWYLHPLDLIHSSLSCTYVLASPITALRPCKNTLALNPFKPCSIFTSTVDLSHLLFRTYSFTLPASSFLPRIHVKTPTPSTRPSEHLHLYDSLSL